MMKNELIIQDQGHPHDKKFLSSYGTMLAETILRSFLSDIDGKEILEGIVNKDSIYFILSQVPLLNIMNELLVAQIKSYEGFVQKKMIDFLVNNPPADNSEASYPEIITEIQTDFQAKQQDSQKLIQAVYDNCAAVNGLIRDFVRKQMTKSGKLTQDGAAEIQAQLLPFATKSEELKTQLIDCKLQWKEVAANSSKDLSYIYQMNELEDLELRSELNFYRSLGMQQ